MEPETRLTRLSEVGNGVTLYGLEYPGFHGCLSWCYLTIGPGVIVATQPDVGDCGTSITNIWDEYFFRLIEPDRLPDAPLYRYQKQQAEPQHANP